MNSLTDQQLLRDYAERRSEAAFAELVRRQVDLVYSAALRMVCDSHLAEDVTQGVFLALARSAPQLTERAVLSGWLHRTAQNIAAQTVRTDVRRRAREQEAAAMNELFATEPDAAWEHIAPHLDAALGALSEADRDALMLRYFERKSAQEMAQVLGVSDEAAQKRVSRAVERLREFFAKRGVTVGASGLVVVICANAVQAAPVGLALAISTAAALAGNTIATTTAATAIKTIAMTTLQKTLITATIAVLAGTGIYKALQVSQLRAQVQILQQLQAPLSKQLTELQAASERLSNQVALARNSHSLSNAQFNELMQLRGRAGVAQADARELAQLKSTLVGQSGRAPDYLTNAMSMGMAAFEKVKMKEALARLARMKQALNLTEDQAREVTEIMRRNVQKQTEMAMEALAGKNTPEQRLAMAAQGSNQDDEIKALLTPEQVATYPQYQQAEKNAVADKSATEEASQIADDFSLSQEQHGQIRAAFYQMNLSEPSKALNKEAIAAAGRSGNMAEAISLRIELSKSQLEEKLKILGSVLTTEQVNAYRVQQVKQIDMMTAAMNAAVKMARPEKPAGSGN